MSKFLRIQCNCGHDLIVFGDSKQVVKCPKCGAVLVEPTGGRAKVNCRILEVLS